MNLLFVMTFKGSLESWSNGGIANREMALYAEYLRRNLFSRIKIFSYSNRDPEFLEKLNLEPAIKNRIDLVLPDRPLGSFWAFLAHSLDISKIRHAVAQEVVVAKTNQISGCWTALLASLFGCRFFLRCGYVLSRRCFKNNDILKGLIALIIEFIAVNLASLVSVTTENSKRYYSRLSLRPKNRIFVAPTYVDSDVFKEKTYGAEQDGKVLFVGRLEPCKNITALIDACRITGMALTIVGNGQLREEIISQAEVSKVCLTHYPLLNNEEIVRLFNSHRYFVLLSFHEGLPKALIEAMCGGMICIGTPTPGITDLISDGATGYLATGFSGSDVADALLRARRDEGAEDRGRAARRQIVGNHSIARYVEREFLMIGRMLG